MKRSQGEKWAVHHHAFSVSMEEEEGQEKGNRVLKHQLTLPGVRGGWMMQKFI